MSPPTSTTESGTTGTGRAWQGADTREGRGRMNSRSGFENDDRQEFPPDALMVRRAVAGSQAWRSAAREVHERADAMGHTEFYGLVRELHATFGPVGSLMRVLARQVAGYADHLPPGQRVYDDSRAEGRGEDPRELLARAAGEMDQLAIKVTMLAIEVNTFWSLIGRIGVEDDPNHPANEHPANEHPANEHPANEHPTGEHPAGGAGGAGVSS